MMTIQQIELPLYRVQQVVYYHGKKVHEDTTEFTGFLPMETARAWNLFHLKRESRYNEFYDFSHWQYVFFTYISIVWPESEQQHFLTPENREYEKMIINSLLN